MKSKRECDAHIDPIGLHLAFKSYCDNCDRGCPMGCIRRKEILHGTDLLNANVASIMSCFSRFVLSKHVDGKLS